MADVERTRRMELRRLELQRMQYQVAVTSSELQIEELHDRIAAEQERIVQTKRQLQELEEKIATARMAVGG